MPHCPTYKNFKSVWKAYSLCGENNYISDLKEIVKAVKSLPSSDGPIKTKGMKELAKVEFGF